MICSVSSISTVNVSALPTLCATPSHRPAFSFPSWSDTNTASQNLYSRNAEISGISPRRLFQGVFHSSVSSAVMLLISAKYLQPWYHAPSTAPVRAFKVFQHVFSQWIIRSSVGFCCGLWGSVYSADINSCRSRFSNVRLHFCILELLLRMHGGIPSSRKKSSNASGPSCSDFKGYKFIMWD